MVFILDSSHLYNWILRCHSCQFYTMFCCSGRIPRLSLIRHSLHVGVVEKSPPKPTHRGVVRKDGAGIP